MLIYKAVNKTNGKIYIGQTVTTLHIRIQRHKSYGNWPIQRAIRKYGLDSFEFTVIDTATSHQELNDKEIYWIAHYNCKAPHGYNLTDGGGGISGWKATPEFRDKISKANKGKVRTPEMRARLSAAKLGVKMSPETCAKRSIIQTGKKLSQATIDKLREAGKRWREANPGALLGRIQSEETRRKIGAAHKGRKHSPESREKCRIANTGKRHSPESRKKMSESRIKFRLPLDELKTRYLAGESALDLAAVYGCSDDIISKNLRAAGVALRDRSDLNTMRYRKNLPNEAIANRYRSGESVNQIAKLFGVTRHAINKVLVEQDVQFRALSPHNVSGYPGVTRLKKVTTCTINVWRASSRLNGKAKNLGHYPTPELAYAAIKAAAAEPAA